LFFLATSLGKLTMFHMVGGSLSQGCVVLVTTFGDCVDAAK